MRTQVAIIGGGPSGLLLGQLLRRAGIESVILERKSRGYVLSRIRAGVLERGLVGLMEQAGCADRLHAEGLVHDGTWIADRGESFRIDFSDLVDQHVVVYGQTEVTRDLYEAGDRDGATILHGVEGVTIHDADSAAPFVTFHRNGTEQRLDCDFVAGCDGFHGVSRRTIPDSVRTEFEKVWPFGWLGILSETPPVKDELIYARSERGFALCSMRNPSLSRYYLQVPATDSPDAWSDDAFWDELRRRLPEADAEALVTGPSIEKSVAPLRSFVSEPMRWGRLFLCGDAAHIVPPTGAKGLNLAASDVHYLSRALIAHYADGDDSGLDGYSATALARVWKAERFSWWFTSLTHTLDGLDPVDLRLQEAELATLRASRHAQAAMAEAYIGLPYEESPR